MKVSYFAVCENASDANLFLVFSEIFPASNSLIKSEYCSGEVKIETCL